MKTVTFSKHPTDLSHQQPQANQDEKDGGRHHTLEMTTEVSSPSAQTWLENFDTDQDSLLDYFLNGEQDESNSNTNAMDDDVNMNRIPQPHGESDKTMRSGLSTSAYDSTSHRASVAFKSIQQSVAHSNHNQQCNESCNPPDPTPPTPIVQFYPDLQRKVCVRSFSSGDITASSTSMFPQERQPQATQQHHKIEVPPAMKQIPSLNAPSSSSPLSLQEMGSAPILNVHQQFKAQAPTPFTVSSMSPISPAAMCTNEVLMLPSTCNPPQPQHKANTIRNQQQWHPDNTGTVRANENSGPVTNSNAAAANPPMQLPAWLQHMNNVACLASQAGSGGSRIGATRPSVQPQNPNRVQNILPNYSNQAQQLHPAMYQPSPRASNLILPIPSSVIAMQQRVNFNSDSGLESKEKREKRLARNRESARQSRRRKKELLVNLRKQVNNLHGQIERERRIRLECMERDLSISKDHILNEIFVEQRYSGQSVAVMDRFISSIRKSGPNIKERRAATIFQYNSLRKLVLPMYRHIFLSMSLRDRNFFTEAKEKMTRESLKTTGRISSKLVGEDISKKYVENTKDIHALKNNMTCAADDKSAFWPLLCYELSIGIEQEEKFIQTLDRTRTTPSMPQARSKLLAVTTMVSNIQESLLSHCCSVTNQNELALLQILTPAQSIRFLEWFLRNKSRYSRLVCKREHVNSRDDDTTGHTTMTKAHSDHSLNEFCKQLKDTMSIKRTDVEG